MIDEKTQGIARRLLDAQLRLRDQALESDAGNIKERMSVRGALMSGMTVSQISQLACQEFRTRTHVAWDTLLRVLSEVGVTPAEELRLDLVVWIERFIEDTFQILATFLNHATSNIGFGAGVGPLQDEATALKSEFEAKADLLIASLTQRATSSPTAAVMHFYGAVGTVQTGAGASATVTQHISQADMAMLKVALDRIPDEIAASADLATDARNELIEVLHDVRGEIAKDKPNSIRIRQLAIGVATAIQTSASLRPAYEALKAALVPLGVTLP